MEEHLSYKTARICLCGCGALTTRRARFARGCEMRLQSKLIKQEVAAHHALARLESAKAEAEAAISLAAQAKQIMENTEWTNADDLISRRDSALYFFKRSRKNRVPLKLE
jgi:hypothetical protein